MGRTGPTGTPSFPARPWISSHSTGSPVAGPPDTFFLSRHIRRHEEELGWPRRLTCHSFRHAFGTHLYENGTDLMTIKTLMGHKSLTSTAIYVHLAVRTMSSVLSPFDQPGGAP